MRERLIQLSFSMAIHLDKDEHETALENLLDLSDPLRMSLWKEFTEDEAITKFN